MSKVDMKSPAGLLHSLVCRITEKKEDDVSPQFQYALRVLGSHFTPSVESDEFQLAERIKRKLVKQRREGDAARFAELHRKLQSNNVVKNRWAILYLLYNLSHGPDRPGIKITAGEALFGQGLPTDATSTPFQHVPGMPGPLRTPMPGGDTTGSSGISSIHTADRSDPTPTPQSFPASYGPTPGITPAQSLSQRQALGNRLALSLSSRQQLSQPHIGNGDMSVATVPSGRATASLSLRPGADNTSFELSEAALLRDVLFVFQGINGKIIKMSSTADRFLIDPKVGVPQSWRDLLGKLSELGWLHNKIRKFVDSKISDRALGLVGQSFCAALQHELTEYYRLVAVLDAQVQQDQDLGVSVGSGGGLTLRRLVVWSYEPLQRLKTLACLVDSCKGKKGGALASVVHSYMQTGDPSLRSLVKHTLNVVSQPIWEIMEQWIYEGDLEDNYQEYFVASDPTVKEDRLWHDKYSLRKSMIPAFITREQADKILLIGKTINFIRQVCQDRSPLKTKAVVKSGEAEEEGDLFTRDVDGSLQQVIDTAYRETSRILLDILHTKYKFMDHLKAMRRYLLLGQGDFIRHLMDLLEPDLNKPASTLYLHNLTGILETAIRATNAQFDDPDILKRIDVRLLEVSPGDCGWDVFSLDYHVDGPISTVFTPETKIQYLRVFNFLWRAKRMEYTLTEIWKDQMTIHKLLLKTVPELASLLHRCHTLSSEMVHFINQMQYYITFEVLECSWDELWKKVKESPDLDHVIASHQVFLDAIIQHCLLDDESRELLTQLRTIFDLIIKFQSAENTMYKKAEEEMNLRLRFLRRIQENTEKGKWGVTELDEEEENTRMEEFRDKFLSKTTSQLRVISQSYQDMVQNFLLMLNEHSDPSLRFLSFRLDFNGHYHQREPKLNRSLSVSYARTRQRSGKDP
ncbi:gamma-tubulin complex component 3-like [Branchiostoma floridae x Branchiostoma belcheri]